MGETHPQRHRNPAGEIVHQDLDAVQLGHLHLENRFRGRAGERRPAGRAGTVPLPQEMPPGDEVTLEVTFTAPQAPGTYRSEWQLQTPNATVAVDLVQYWALP